MAIHCFPLVKIKHDSVYNVPWSWLFGLKVWIAIFFSQVNSLFGSYWGSVFQLGEDNRKRRSIASGGCLSLSTNGSTFRAGSIQHWIIKKKQEIPRGFPVIRVSDVFNSSSKRLSTKGSHLQGIRAPHEVRSGG